MRRRFRAAIDEFISFLPSEIREKIEIALKIRKKKEMKRKTIPSLKMLPRQERLKARLTKWRIVSAECTSSARLPPHKAYICWHTQ